MFCRHKWRLVDKTVLPSLIEVAAKSGASKMQTSASMAKDMLQRTVISILACEKCGKVKKFVERG